MTAIAARKGSGFTSAQLSATELRVTASQKKFVTVGPSVLLPGTLTLESRNPSAHSIGSVHWSLAGGPVAPLLMVYLHAGLELKQRTLDRITPPDGHPGRYRTPDPLLAFLDSL